MFVQTFLGTNPEATLSRFLRAREFNVHEATQMVFFPFFNSYPHFSCPKSPSQILDCLDWRIRHDVDNILSVSFSRYDQLTQSIQVLLSSMPETHRNFNTQEDSIKSILWHVRPRLSGRRYKVNLEDFCLYFLTSSLNFREDQLWWFELASATLTPQ